MVRADESESESSPQKLHIHAAIFKGGIDCIHAPTNTLQSTSALCKCFQDLMEKINYFQADVKSSYNHRSTPTVSADAFAETHFFGVLNLHRLLAVYVGF